MGSPTEQQMAGSLRQIKSQLESMTGLRNVFVISDRANTSQVIPHQPKVGYQRLIVSVYSLEGKKPESPEKEEKAKTPAVNSKASITVKVRCNLLDGETYQVASQVITVKGQETIFLDICPNQMEIAIDIEGSAEYAVFGM